jgi:Fe-S-cluster containining protein
MTDKCKKCNAYCCRHVAIAVDTPSDKEDYDNIRWYLLHKNVWVSVSHTDEWIVEFRTPCRHIRSDYKCGDYPNRPLICKNYPDPDDLCEGETEEPSYKELFKNVKDFERYLRKCK